MIWSAVRRVGVAAIAAVVVLAAACVERPPAADDGADASVQGATGTVGAELTLPGGENLNTVSYTLTNGVNTYTGVVDVSGSSSATFVLSNIASGAGYVLRLNAVSADTNVVCTGSSTPFAVSDRATTMVLVQLVCIVTHDAGGIVIGGTPVNCAVWNTIVANPSQAQSGGSVSLNAAATAPDPGTLTFTWTVTTGSGTVSNNTSTVTANDAGATDMATFTCPPTGGEVDTITLVVSDGPLPDGGSCPTADTTGTVQVTCGAPPCIGGFPAAPNTPTGSCPGGTTNSGFPNSFGIYCCTVGPPCLLGNLTQATPNTATGTCPAGSVNIGADSNGNYCCGSACSQSTLVPCTGPNQYCCTPCPGSANGYCSPTEALLVAHDIANGKVTRDAGEGAGDCYACLLNAGCLDDVTFGDTNHECGDFAAATFPSGPAAGSSDSTLCLDTLSCILRTSCAASGTGSGCYCGSQPISSCAMDTFGAVDGPCKLQEIEGLSPILPQLLATFTDPSTPSGRANYLVACATSNACTSCLTNGSGATPACPATFSNSITDVTVSTAGGSTTITQTVVNPPTVTAVWSAFAGTLGNEQQSGSSVSATFTCPAAGGAIPVTLIVNGGPRANCPTTDNTLTTTVHCPAGPGDGGTDASDASSPPACDAAALVPCTSTGQTCCVPCSASSSGLCTPTEAMIVAKDIAKGNATTMGVAPSGCYSCLVNGGCIDDITFGDTAHECEDLTGLFGAGAKAGTSESLLCLQTLQCILASPSCASSSISSCYCGTAGVTTACQGNPAPGPINGACAQQIADGLGYPPSDGTDITKHLTDQTLPAGMADQVLVCAIANTCAACLQ
jgi:hypothetical protein